MPGRSNTSSSNEKGKDKGCSASKDEVNRLMDDISRATKSSTLLRLLRCSRHHTGNNNKYNRSDSYDSNRVKKDGNHNDCATCVEGISAVSTSTLDEHIGPIREALERIDPQRLLDLKLIRSSPSSCSSPKRNNKNKRKNKNKRRSISPKSKNNIKNGEEDVKAPRIKDGVFCRPICDQIRPKIHLNNNNNNEDDGDNDNNCDDRTSVVRYLHVAEIPDQYTIGIFVFGPNERIPLHDHPEMCVVSRILYGDVQRFSLDLDRQGDKDISSLIESIKEEKERRKKEEELSSSWLSRSMNLFRMSSNNNHNDDNDDGNGDDDNKNNSNRSFPEGTKLAFKNKVDTLQAPAVAVLYPYEGNLHEFVAGPYGAAVLDVLLPPYDDEEERDCTFYTIREIITAKQQQQQQQQPRKEVSNDATKENSSYSLSPLIVPSASSLPLLNTEKDPCLIVPTGQPEDFHCISGRYRDIGECEEEEDLYFE